MSEGTDTERPGSLALLWRAREVLLAKPAWLDYVRQVYAIDPGGYPFLSYVGLNFTKHSLKNYKLYFSFFKRLSEQEITQLLPVADRGRFDQLYPLWHPSREYKTIHRGTTFALKIDADGTLTHYYHLRLQGLPFGPPERLALQDSDRHNYHGACEEFTAGKINLKRYFYCRDKGTIAQSLGACGLPEDPSQIDLLEYIESEGRDKMAWITGDPNLIQTLVRRQGQPRLGSGLAKIAHDCGFQLYGPGSARDGSDHSIYFILLEGQLGAYGYIFDGVRRFLTHHLKLDTI